MNNIKAEIQKSEYGYIDYLQFIIDDEAIDEILEKEYPDNFYKGLVPTINSWMENNKEREVVWNRILPLENEVKNAPILMCPDDCDFSCTIIIAQIENKGDRILWNKIGLDQTKFEYNYPNGIGTNIKWFESIPKYEFDIIEYKNVVNEFEIMMSLEDIEWKILFWLESLNETETIPKSIEAMNFGIFESDDEFTIYLSGSNSFDEKDDDWANKVDYEPKYKCQGLGKSSKKNNWEVILKKVKESLEIELSKNQIFSPIKHLTVGFDDGELLKLKKE